MYQSASLSNRQWAGCQLWACWGRGVVSRLLFVTNEFAEISCSAHRHLDLCSFSFNICRSTYVGFRSSASGEVDDSGLEYVVQGHRFDIYEDIGCYPALYNTLLRYFISSMWPIVIGLISAAYGSMSLYLRSLFHCWFAQCCRSVHFTGVDLSLAAFSSRATPLWQWGAISAWWHLRWPTFSWPHPWLFS